LKKSEFVHLLVNDDIMHGLICQANNEVDVFYVISRLITRMEKLGMAPPLYAPNDSGLLYSDEESGEPNGFNIQIREWERES